MGAAPASQSEDLCRTKRSLSDKGTPRYRLAMGKIRAEESLTEVLRIPRYGSCGWVGSGCNITTGQREKKARRTDWSGHKTRNAKDDYILHHEQNLSLSKDGTQYSKPGFLHAFYKSFMESIWHTGTPFISSA